MIWKSGTPLNTVQQSLLQEENDETNLWLKEKPLKPSFQILVTFTFTWCSGRWRPSWSAQMRARGKCSRRRDGGKRHWNPKIIFYHIITFCIFCIFLATFWWSTVPCRRPLPPLLWRLQKHNGKRLCISPSRHSCTLDHNENGWNGLCVDWE